MIFDGLMVAAAIKQAQAFQEQETQALRVMADIMSPADFDAAVKRIEARRQLARQRELDERRHQETIAAIRSTSFWRFGG